MFHVMAGLSFRCTLFFFLFLFFHFHKSLHCSWLALISQITEDSSANSAYSNQQIIQVCTRFAHTEPTRLTGITKQGLNNALDFAGNYGK